MIIWNLISSSMNFLGFRRYCNAIKTLKPCLDYFCYNFLTFHWGIISQSSNLCLYFVRLPPSCSQSSFQLWLSFQWYFIIIKLISDFFAENFITTSFVLALIYNAKQICAFCCLESLEIHFLPSCLFTQLFTNRRALYVIVTSIKSLIIAYFA